MDHCAAIEKCGAAPPVLRGEAGHNWLSDATARGQTMLADCHQHVLVCGGTKHWLSQLRLGKELGRWDESLWNFEPECITYFK